MYLILLCSLTLGWSLERADSKIYKKFIRNLYVLIKLHQE